MFSYDRPVIETSHCFTATTHRYCVAVHPGGDRLFASRAGKPVSLWDIDAQVEMGTLSEANDVRRMAVNPGGDLLYTLDESGFACWEVSTLGRMYTIDDHRFVDQPIRFTRAGHGRTLAREGNKLILWDLVTCAVLRRFQAGSGSVKQALLAADAEHVLAVDGSNVLRRFHAESGACLGEWPVEAYSPAGRPLEVALHSNGREALSITFAETALWDAERGALRWRVAGPSPHIETATFHPSEPLALVQGHNGSVELWDLAEGRALRPPGMADGPWARGAFCGRPWQIALLASDEREFRVIPVDRDVRPTALNARGPKVLFFVPLPDGRRLVTVHHDETMMIWDVTHRARVGLLGSPPPPPPPPPPPEPDPELPARRMRQSATPRDGKTMKQWIEAEAEVWENGGSRDEDLLGVWDVTVASSWRISRGGGHEGLSQRANAFVQKSFDTLKGWYNGLLSTRDWCSRCGESYRIENLSLCTHCDRLRCYRCQDDLATHDNGNRRCTCQWGGEIVG